ncbi:hypothetical protein TKK_0002047 [Trichogramma kaykai]
MLVQQINIYLRHAPRVPLSKIVKPVRWQICLHIQPPTLAVALTMEEGRDGKKEVEVHSPSRPGVVAAAARDLGPGRAMLSSSS